MERNGDYLSEETRHVLEQFPEDAVIFLLHGQNIRFLLATKSLLKRLDHDILSIAMEEKKSADSHFLHPDDAETFSGLLRLAASHPGETYQVRVRLRFLPGGGYMWCSGLMTAGGNVSDNERLIFITQASLIPAEPKPAVTADREKLRELLLNKVLDTTNDCIFWKDSQRRFVGVNKAFLKFYGFSSENVLIGKTDEEMGWHENPEPFRRDELRVLSGESTLLVHGKCMIHGESRDILATKAPVYDNGKIIGLVGSFIDVTGEYQQRRKIETLDGQLKDALEKEKKTNQDLNLFMSRVSHELRTPMNAVIGLSSLGMNTTDLGEAIDYLHKINSSGEYLMGIINDVLDINKMDGGNFHLHEAPSNIVEILDAAETIIRPLAEKKDIHFSIDSFGLYQPDVICDHIRVEQILVNLLNNAVKFTEPAGHVTLTCAEESVGDSVRIIFEVQDDGCGMGREFLKHIFEPFEQENKNPGKYGSGSGLGLAIARNLARQMHGDITVKSKENVGSTFTASMLLRVSGTVPEAMSAAPKTVPKPDSFSDLAGLRVLIADDNLLNREITAEILKQAGIESEFAADGEEALEKFEESREGWYDAILLDLIMPVMDGYVAASQIRSLHREDARCVPLIAVSGDIFGDSVQRAKDHGMGEFITKPIERVRLLETLRRAVREVSGGHT